MAREVIFQARKKDFNVQWFSGTGPGGQHRNKHQNCVRITHIPTGMRETCQSHRERSRNLREAFKALASRLVENSVREEKRSRYGNSEMIRTYHAVDNYVKDSVSGETEQFSPVLEGKKLGKMIEARKLGLAEQKVENTS